MGRKDCVSHVEPEPHTHKKTIWPTTIANEEMNRTKLVGSKACKARKTCNRRQAARETLVNDVTSLVPDWLIRTEKISLLTAPAEKAKKNYCHPHCGSFNNAMVLSVSFSPFKNTTCYANCIEHKDTLHF